MAIRGECGRLSVYFLGRSSGPAPTLRLIAVQRVARRATAKALGSLLLLLTPQRRTSVYARDIEKSEAFEGVRVEQERRVVAL